ncbi:MAG: hypothetical protein ACRD1X_01315 [Vicinamibacteria bacterium]
MRNLWIGTRLVPFTWIGNLLVPILLLLAASAAAQEPEGPELRVLNSEAQYLGPVLSDHAEEQRLAQRRQALAGDIDVYNVWTSFQKIKFNSNYTIVGHSYQICQDLHSTLTFGSLIYALYSPIQVQVEHRLSGGGGVFTCAYDLPATGEWLLTCDISSRELRAACDGPDTACFYKVKSTHRVTGGGSGSGKETASFDVYASCP